MAYRISKGEREYYIGNGSLLLTPEAMHKLSEVLDADGDPFDFISEAVNCYVENDGFQKLDAIEGMLKELLNGNCKVTVDKGADAPSAPQPPVEKPKIKFAKSSDNVDLMKALQNMKKLTGEGG